MIAMLSTLERYGRAALNRLLMLFRPGEPTVREVTYRGHDFLALVNEDVGWRMRSPVRFEHAEFEVLRERIEPDFTCLDVGANIGVHTVLLADMAPRGRIYAFEPDERAYRLLNLNLQRNGVDHARTFKKPVSDRKRDVSFHESVDSAFSAVEPTGRRDVRRRVKRTALTLDGFVEERGLDPDFVKIDVEGHEPAVLRGMQRQLADADRGPRYLLVEVDRRHTGLDDRASEGVVSYLEERGYRARSIGSAGLGDGFDPDRVVQNVLFTAD